MKPTLIKPQYQLVYKCNKVRANQSLCQMPNIMSSKYIVKHLMDTQYINYALFVQNTTKELNKFKLYVGTSETPLATEDKLALPHFPFPSVSY